MNNFIKNNISSGALNFIDSYVLDQSIKESENLDQFYANLNYYGLKRFFDHELAINNIFIDKESDEDNEKYDRLIESIYFNFLESDYDDELLENLIESILEKRERN